MDTQKPDWRPISEVPRDGKPLRFRHRDGEEFDGTWQPFWCGSDCPCDVAGEGYADMAEPDCWCAYRAGAKHGEDITPESFAALTQA